MYGGGVEYQRGWPGGYDVVPGWVLPSEGEAVIGPFEFSNPETVMMSATARNIAISIWDAKGVLHEFLATRDGDEIWFGAREDYEAK